AADEPYDGIALALGCAPAVQSFLFQLGDGGDIKLRRVLRNLVRECFVLGASVHRDRQSYAGSESNGNLRALLWSARVGLCGSFGVIRVNEDLHGAPSGIGSATRP